VIVLATVCAFVQPKPRMPLFVIATPAGIDPRVPAAVEFKTVVASPPMRTVPFGAIVIGPVKVLEPVRMKPSWPVIAATALNVIAPEPEITPVRFMYREVPDESLKNVPPPAATVTGLLKLQLPCCCDMIPLSSVIVPWPQPWVPLRRLLTLLPPEMLQLPVYVSLPLPAVNDEFPASPTLRFTTPPPVTAMLPEPESRWFAEFDVLKIASVRPVATVQVWFEGMTIVPAVFAVAAVMSVRFCVAADMSMPDVPSVSDCPPVA